MWTLSGRHRAHHLKMRRNLREARDSVVQHREATAAAEKFVTELQELIASERTYITAEKKFLPGQKQVKGKLTLMLCTSTSGDYKIKPLLIYHSDNP